MINIKYDEIKMAIDSGPTAADIGLTTADMAVSSSDTGDALNPLEPAVSHPGRMKLSDKLKELEDAERSDPDHAATDREPDEDSESPEAFPRLSIPESDKNLDDTLDTGVRLLRIKASELRQKDPNSLTDEQFSLLTVDTFVYRGFGKATYDKYEDEGGIPVGGDLVVNGVKVLRITGEETTKEDEDTFEGKIYSCVIEDPSDPDHKIAKISGDKLAEAHMALNVTEIAGNFDDPSEKVLAEWIAKGGSEDIPLDPAKIQEIQEKLKSKEAENVKGFPAEDVRSLIKLISPDESNHTPEVQKLLKSIEGKTALTREDFQRTIKLMGGSSEAFAQRDEEIIAEIGRLKNLQNISPSETLRLRIEELQAEQAAIGIGFKVFSDAEKDEKNPFDDLFDKAENGQIDPKQFEVVRQAISSGDMKLLLDEFSKTQNLTDNEKSKILKYSKSAGKGALWLLALALIVPAIAVTSAAAAAINTQGKR
jgi:rubrerythrin